MSIWRVFFKNYKRKKNSNISDPRINWHHIWITNQIQAVLEPLPLLIALKTRTELLLLNMLELTDPRHSKFNEESSRIAEREVTKSWKLELNASWYSRWSSRISFPFNSRAAPQIWTKSLYNSSSCWTRSSGYLLAFPPRKAEAYTNGPAFTCTLILPCRSMNRGLLST